MAMDSKLVRIFPEFYIFVVVLIVTNMIGFFLGEPAVSYIKEMGWAPSSCKVGASSSLVFTSTASVAMAVFSLILNAVFFLRKKNFSRIRTHVIKIPTGSKVIGLFYCAIMCAFLGAETLLNDCSPGVRFGDGLINQFIVLFGTFIFGLFVFCAICFLAGLVNDENIVTPS